MAGKLLIRLLSIVVAVIVLTYVFKLEETSCECSKDWRRDYIKYYSMATLGLIALVVLLGMLGLNLGKNVAVRVVLTLVSFAWMVATLTNVYAMFTYTQQLVCHQTCQCSTQWQRTFLYYYSMIVASFLLVGLGVMLVVLTSSLATKGVSGAKSAVSAMGKRMGGK